MQRSLSDRVCLCHGRHRAALAGRARLAPSRFGATIALGALVARPCSAERLPSLPWLLASTGSRLNDLLVGVAFVALSPPLGKGREHFGRLRKAASS